jgi:ABC-type nickel/cobalt efflux system permease component RcnA
MADGFGVGLLVAALLLGLRHGIDWDHIAAIGDLTATTQDQPKNGVVLGTLYALGHAAVVVVLGVGAIMLGRAIPPAIDEMMGRVVGWTLLLLGGYVIFSLITQRGQFRPRSRWMLLFAAARRVAQTFNTFRRRRTASIVHSHAHAAVDGVHHQTVEENNAEGTMLTAPRHIHSHAHEPGHSDNYSKAGSAAIGMLHGVGAETPTQVLVFLAAANAGGAGAGVAVLLSFVVGLLISNTAITLSASFGFRVASRRVAFHLILGTLTALVSLWLGTLLVLGREAGLPALLAG